MGQTVREIIKSGFKPFMKLDDVRTQRNQINAVQYIETLSATTKSQRTVDGWDLFKLFGSSKNPGLVITNKNLINKKFFEALSKSPPPPIGRNLTKDDEKRLLVLAESLAEGRGDGYHQERKEECLQEARRNMARARENLQEARKIALAAKDSTELAKQIVNDIKLVNADGYWKFHEIEGDKISFVTKNDVIVDWKKEKANIHLRVNFGKFKAVIDFSQSDDEDGYGIQCFEFQKNIIHQNCTHPHVGVEGNICWGTASETVAEKFIENKIREIMALLAQVLDSYNDDEPFVDLAYFQALSPKTAPPGTKLKEKCDDCEQPLAECEC
jgi:hypothetical protein